MKMDIMMQKLQHSLTCGGAGRMKKYLVKRLKRLQR